MAKHNIPSATRTHLISMECVKKPHRNDFNMKLYVVNRMRRKNKMWFKPPTHSGPIKIGHRDMCDKDPPAPAHDDVCVVICCSCGYPPNWLWQETHKNVTGAANNVVEWLRRMCCCVPSRHRGESKNSQEIRRREMVIAGERGPLKYYDNKGNGFVCVNHENQLWKKHEHCKPGIYM
jgi:hypothetical protein